MDADIRFSYMVLLGQSMPHIIERIFLNLDRKSIKNCQKVCQRWEEILSSDHFKTTWHCLHPQRTSWTPQVVYHWDHKFMEMLM